MFYEQKIISVKRGCRGRMIVGFTTTYSIIAYLYHH